jgi:tetratricopeptide (TPR) repeat protein
MSVLRITPANCLRISGLLLASAALLSPALAQTKAAAGASILQQRYEAAQRYQAAHQLDQAAAQYRIFLADAIGQIAIAQIHAGDYEQAAGYFDEALHLVPQFPMMQLEYARAALDSGNLEHAKLLATGVLQGSPGNSKAQAGAHAILGRVLLKMDKDTDARQQIEQAVALDPTFENGYELAIADLDLGDGNAAKKIFAEMLASFGDTAAIHLYFGQAYGGSDFPDDAEREFKQAIAQDDHLPGAHYSLAAAYLSTAGDVKLPDAEAELRKEIAVSPESAAAYAALGHLLAAQRHDAAEDAEAEADLKRATTLDPRNPDAFLYLGQLYADLKRPADAAPALRQSIALTKDPSRNAYQVQKAHYLLGRVLLQTGATDAGKQEMAASQALQQQALARDQNRLSDYLQQNQSKRADAGMGPQMPISVEQKPADAAAFQQMEAFEKEMGPAIADSYNNLGAIAGSKGDYPDALRSFEHAAEWSPALPGLDFNWGRAAFAAGAFAQAVGPIGRYLNAHPDDEGARTVLGLSQFMEKDYANARQTLEPLEGKSSEPLQVQYAYAQSLVETGDTRNGVARLLALEKADPKVAEVHRALGEAYAAERSPAAASELEAALRLDPSDAEALAALGRFELTHGNSKDAILHLEAASKLDPDNAALRQELAEASRKSSRN